MDGAKNTLDMAAIGVETSKKEMTEIRKILKVWESRDYGSQQRQVTVKMRPKFTQMWHQFGVTLGEAVD